jgi:hypothetical protein
VRKRGTGTPEAQQHAMKRSASADPQVSTPCCKWALSLRPSSSSSLPTQTKPEGLEAPPERHAPEQKGARCGDVRLAASVQTFQVHDELMVHVPACECVGDCLSTARALISAAEGDPETTPPLGYLSFCRTRAKNYRVFFFPSPRHDLETEAAFSEVLAQGRVASGRKRGRLLSEAVKFAACARRDRGLEYYNAAAIIVGEVSRLRGFAAAYRPDEGAMESDTAVELLVIPPDAALQEDHHDCEWPVCWYQRLVHTLPPFVFVHRG